MNTNTSKPAVKKHLKPLLLGGVFLLLVFASFYIIRNYQFLKHTLLRQVLSPAAYLTYVEHEYLSAQSERFQAHFSKAQAQLTATPVTGADITLQTNQLLADYLKDVLSFQSAALSLRHDTQPEHLTLIGTLAVDKDPRLTLCLWSDTVEKQCFLQLPELSSGVLSCSYSSDFLPVYLIQETITFLHSCILSLHEQVQADPYSYLLPYLDILKEVSVKEATPLPVEESSQTALCMTASISLQKAMEIASIQLEDMEESNPLLPLFHLLSRLLEEWSATYDLSLLITAYIDDVGQIIGHEFALLYDNQALLTLTGLLLPDSVQGKTGTLYLTYFSPITSKEYRLPLELEQFFISSETGLPNGTLLFPVPELSAVSASLEFYERNGLPEASLRLRALGFTAVSVAFSLSTETASLPVLPPDAVIYPPSDWKAYFSTLDFGAETPKP